MADDGSSQSSAAEVTLDVGDVPGDDLWSARPVSLAYSVQSEFAGMVGDGSHGSLDVDLFSVFLNYGDRLLVDIDADELDSGVPFSELDSHLRIFDEYGSELVTNDDGADPDTGVNHLDSVISFSADYSGNYLIGVSGYGNTGYDPSFGGSGQSGSVGEYRLQLTLSQNQSPIAADDSVTLSDDAEPVAIAVLSNDFDPDGDVVTLASIDYSSIGNVWIEYDSTFNADVVMFEPVLGMTGTESINYYISDPSGAAATATIAVEVVSVTGGAGENSAPVAGDDNATVAEGSSVTIAVLANDSDPDGDSLTLQYLDSYPSYGSAWIQYGSSGTPEFIVYDAYSGFTGVDLLSYVISDDHGNESTATVTVTITAAASNNAPVAVSDDFTVSDDGSAHSLDVLSNDSDPDGDPLTIQSVSSGPQHGTATIDVDGFGNTVGVVYTPDGTFEGSDSFVYSIVDPSGASAQATVSIQEQAPANQPPAAFNDIWEVTAGQTLTVSPPGYLANVSDPDDDTITGQLVSGVSHGTLSFGADGSFSYTPDAGFTGADQFIYKASDGSLVSGNATVSLSVVANQPPTALEDQYAGIGGQEWSIGSTDGVLSNDSDPEGATLSAILVNDVDYGTLTLNSDGSFSYLSDSGVTGTDQFTYQVSDGAGLSAPVTVLFQIYGGPVWAVDDFYSTGHDDELDIAINGVIGNDWDQNGDTLTASLVSDPGFGVVTLNTDGSFFYTPDSGFVGLDSFTYQVTDGTVASNVGTVTVEVTNFAPVAVDDFFRTSMGTTFDSLSWSTTDNDFDGERDALSAELVTDVSFGSLTLNENGTFSYTPNPGFAGQDFFVYRVLDDWAAGTTATVQIEVANAAPVTRMDSFETLVDLPLVVMAPDGLLENDSDTDGHGFTAALEINAIHGNVLVNSDGSFTYVPDSGFTGIDGFEYRVTDDFGASSTGNVTVKVTNTAPIAGGDVITVRQNGNVLSGPDSLLANDVDADGHALTAQIESQPSSGTATVEADGTWAYVPDPGFTGTDLFTYTAFDGYQSSVSASVEVRVSNHTPAVQGESFSVHHGTMLVVNADSSLLKNDVDGDGDPLVVIPQTSAPNGSLLVNPDGTFTYTPNAGFAGDDSFTYTVSDGFGESSVVEAVIIVTNSDPQAEPDSYEVAHDQILTVVEEDGVLVSDFDADGDSLTAVLVEMPTSGTVSFEADGSFIYTPNAGFTGSDSFSYHVSDGASQTDPVPVAIDVINSAPTGVDAAYSVHHGQILNVVGSGLTTGAVDLDQDTLSVVTVQSPFHGTLSLGTGGAFTYTPNSGFIGEDSFQFRLDDSVASSDVLTATINVSNAPPVAASDSFSLSHDRQLTVDLLANDLDTNDDTLTATLLTLPANGSASLSPAGEFVYTPAAGFTGTESLSYQISDGAEVSTATVSVYVLNATPVAESDSYGVLIDDTLNVLAGDGLLANDDDADNDMLTASLINDALHGTLALQSDGTFSYTPDVGFVGVDSFSYQISDGLVGSEVTSVILSVFDAELVAVEDSITLSHDQTVTIRPLDNDFNWLSESVSLSVDSPTTNGSLVDNGDGTLTYTPNSQFVGSDSFSYSLTSNSTATGPIAVSLNVVNSVPQNSSSGLSYRLRHGQSLTVGEGGDFGSLVFDADSDSLTLQIDVVPVNGIASVGTDGRLVYTPDPGFIGNDSFSVAFSDGLTVSSPVLLSVNVVNNVPIVFVDHAVVHAGEVLTGSVLENDRDIDGDSLTAQLVTSPTSGTVMLNLDGTYTYTPDSGFLGQDTFTYLASDGITDSPVATVIIEVTNDAPLGIDEQFRVGHDQVLTGNVVTNDIDANGDELTVTLASDVSNGLLVLNSDGSFTYTPQAAFSGTDSFSYIVSDEWSSSSPVTVAIDVTNHTPRALDDRFTIRRGQTVSFDGSDLLANDSDADGDSIAVELLNEPSNGVLAVLSDGSFLYTPHVSFAGEETFSYRVSDGVTQSSPASITITVLNDAPSAAEDQLSVIHDRSIGIADANVFENDFDVDGDLMTAVLVSDATHGTLTLQADGFFSYTPDSGFVGQDEFRYEVTDGLVTSRPVVVTIDVKNSRPVVSPSQHHVSHDQTLVVDADSGLLSNAVDADGDMLTFSILAHPVNGALTTHPDGSFDYVPNPSFKGQDSFLYSVSDGVSAEVIQAITIDVRNTAPNVAPDVVLIPPEVSSVTFPVADLLVNDVDFDGDDLTVIPLTEPAHGTLSFDPVTDTFTYSKDPAWPGDSNFIYKASDGISSATASVLLQTTRALSGGVASLTGGGVPASPIAPAAGADSYDVVHDRSLSVGSSYGVLDNDVDPNGDLLTTVLVTSTSNGSLTLNSDGSFDYWPSQGFVGADSFTYRAYDGGLQSSVATVTINVTNQAPTATASSFSIHHDTQLSQSVNGLIGSGIDPDGDSVTFHLDSSTSNGSLSFQGDGTFTYQPAAGFVGSDSFTWHVSDGISSSPSVSTVIDVTNQQPVGRSQYFRGHQGDTLTVGGSGVLALSLDLDGDALTVVPGASAPNGQLTLNSDGSFEFVPNPGFVGVTSFTYQVDDGAELSLPATVTLDIQNVAPGAAESVRTVHHGDAITIDLHAWDVDGDDIAFDIVSLPSSGTLTFSPISPTNPHTLGPFTYTAGHTLGTDSFEFRVWDGAEWSANTKVDINITNARPFGIGTARALRPGDTVTIASLAGFAADPDGDALTVSLGSSGTLGTASINAAGHLTYVAGNTPGTETITFTVDDQAETSEPVPLTFEIINTAPVAFDRNLTVHHSLTSDVFDPMTQSHTTGYLFDLTAGLHSAYDAESDPLTFTMPGNPSAGTASMDNDGILQFIPPGSGFTGTVTLDYVANDSYVDSNTAKITINVVNSAPIALDDHLSVAHGRTLTITPEMLLANDLDVDGDAIDISIGGLTLVSTIVGTGPGTLTPNVDGNGVPYSWEYDPGGPGFVGSVSFDYTVFDGAETSGAATVTIDVANTIPAVFGDSAYGLAGTTVSVGTPQERNAVWDMEGDELTVALVSVAPPGLTFNSDGSYTYQFTDTTAFFRYKVFDGAQWSTPATVYLEGYNASEPVLTDLTKSAAPNQPPVANPDGRYDVERHQLLSADIVSIFQNDFDPDNEPVSLVSSGIPVDHLGYFTYQSSSQGAIDIPYTITDGVDTASSFFRIYVNNQAPVGHISYEVIPVRNDPANTSEAWLGYLPQDPDYNPQTQLYDPVTLSGPAPTASNGTLTITTSPGAGGQSYSSITYLPDVGFSGIETFSVSGEDDLGAVGTSELHVSVTDDPNFRWDVIETVSDSGMWWKDPILVNVLNNDWSPDGDDLTVLGAMPTGGEAFNSSLSLIDADEGIFEFYPFDPDAFAVVGADYEYTVVNEAGVTKQVSLGFSVAESGGGDGSGPMKRWMGSRGLTREPVIRALPDLTWMSGNGATLSNGVGSLVVTGGDITIEGSPQHLLIGNASSVGDVTASASIAVSSTGPIGNVSAPLVRSVSGSVIASVNASGNIGFVGASTSIGSVSSGGSIGFISGGELAGNVTASGSISSITVGSISGNLSAASIGYTTFTEYNFGNATGVAVVEDISGDITATSGGISRIMASGDISGDVSANGPIWQITAGGDISGDITTGGGDGFIDRIQVGPIGASGNLVANLTGDITASGKIRSFNVTGDMSGDAQSVELGTLVVGGDLTGSVDGGQRIHRSE